MDSSSTLTTHHHHHRKPLQKHLPPPPPRSSRRTPSFSSSSSSASFSPYNSSSSESVLYFPGDDDGYGDHPSRSYSPMRGVPFSWEHLPGIPKKQTCHKKMINNIHHHQESSMKLLPLPPPTNNNSTSSSYSYKRENSLQSVFQRDPFFAAMVECSKGDFGDDDDHRRHHGRGGGGRESNTNNKVSRSMSDRLGFVDLYSSCKNASAISESIIYLPTSRRPSRANYHHFSRRRSL